MPRHRTMFATILVLVMCYASALFFAEAVSAATCSIACAKNSQTLNQGPPNCVWTVKLRAATVEEYCCPMLNTIVANGGTVVHDTTENWTVGGGCTSDVNSLVSLLASKSPGSVKWTWANGWGSCAVTVNFICSDD